MEVRYPAGALEEARDLRRQVHQHVETVASRVGGRAAPTVFYELDATPYSVGPGSYIHDLIEMPGGDTIVEEGMGEFPQVDTINRAGPRLGDAIERLARLFHPDVF